VADRASLTATNIADCDILTNWFYHYVLAK
jgi:hypothetical protein